MAPKQTISRLLNPLPALGWAKIHPTRYHAVELPDEPGVFLCQARGDGQWTAAQLEAWALEIGAEVALVEWVRAPVPVLQNETMGPDPVNVEISDAIGLNKRAT